MIRRRRSLRFVLTSWYSGVVGAVLFVWGALLYGAVHYQYLHHHDEGLRADARAVSAILLLRPDCSKLAPAQVERLALLNSRILLRELGRGEEEIFRSSGIARILPAEGLAPRIADIEADSFSTFEGRAGAVRMYSTTVASPEGPRCVVLVMDSLGHVTEALSTLRWSLLLTVPLALLVAATVGYWLAGRALRPVDEITSLARKIEATNLSQRLPVPSLDDELGRLTNTLNQMIARLEESFSSMRRFTADASHELRTPLTIMHTAIDVALGRERNATEYRQTLAALLEEVIRTSRIVDDLMFLARADSGNLPLQKEPVQLDVLVSEVAVSMGSVASARGVSLEVGASASISLVADERWLRQMLYNLVDNAIKFTGPEGRVELTIELQNDAAILSVSDCGAGIPESQQARLFERFYRVDDARSRDTGGAGLGLAIALGIARLHGGDIRVESRQGQGSTFKAYLPRASSTGVH